MTMMPPLPVAIETDRLILRPFAPDDAPALYEAVVQSRERVGKWLPWVPFYTDQSAADAFIGRCRQHWHDATELPFAIFDRESGRFLGGIRFAGIGGFSKRATGCAKARKGRGTCAKPFAPSFAWSSNTSTPTNSPCAATPETMPRAMSPSQSASISTASPATTRSPRTAPFATRS